MDQLKWETNLKNGIFTKEFDRKDIPMNKMIVITLENKIHLFDLRTLHPEVGYFGLSDAAHNSTIWRSKFGNKMEIYLFQWRKWSSQYL